MDNPLLDLLSQIRDPSEDADLAPVIESLATGIEGQATALQTREETIAERDAEITRLKLSNYELMTKIPVAENAALSEQEKLHENESPTIEGLFQKVGE